MSKHTNVIRLMCPNLACQQVLAVPESARGKLVRCRGCSTVIRVPESPSGSSGPQKDEISA
jgi:hypothetical protein